VIKRAVAPRCCARFWGDNERYLSTYWEKFQNRYYVAGDSARRDKDGYYWIMGRIDGRAERRRSPARDHGKSSRALVAQSASCGIRPWSANPTTSRAESVFAYVVLNVPRPEGRAPQRNCRRNCAAGSLNNSAPSPSPTKIRLTDNLPKTRSGKIMRRLLRSIARGEEITQGHVDAGESRDPRTAARWWVGEPAPAMQAAPGMRAAPAKQAAPGMRASSAMRAVRSERGAGVKKVAARPERRKKTAVRIRRGKAKKNQKSRPKARQASNTSKKNQSAKVVAAKSRRAAVQSGAPEKPRGKKVSSALTHHTGNGAVRQKWPAT